MNPSELKTEISRLNLKDKISLVEDLWDSIAAESNHLPLPEWQKQALDQRYQEFLSGETKLHEADQVHDQLRAKYRP